jgi:heat shock protein HslJ
MKPPRHHPALALALLVALAACTTPYRGGPAGNYLENTRWWVLSVDGQGVPQAVEEAPFIVADPSTGRVQGHAGCNTFNGPYRAGGRQLAFGPLAMTRKACPGTGDWEATLTAALTAADGYRVEGDRLLLLREGEVRVRLQAAGS